MVKSVAPSYSDPLTPTATSELNTLVSLGNKIKSSGLPFPTKEPFFKSILGSDTSSTLPQAFIIGNSTMSHVTDRLGKCMTPDNFREVIFIESGNFSSHALNDVIDTLCLMRKVLDPVML